MLTKSHELPPSRSRLTRFVTSVGILVILIFNLLTLDSYPIATCDEALYASQAAQLLETGSFGLGVYEAGDPFFRDANMVHMGRLNAVIEAGLFALGGITWWVSRLSALGISCIAVVLLYRLGARLYGSTVGLAASALFAVSLRMFLSAHILRPEIFGVCYTLIGILGLVAMFNKPKGFRFAVGMGLLAMLTVDSHFYLFGFVLGFCCVVFVRFALMQRNIPVVLGYACGVLIGGGLWMLVHFQPNPTESWYQVSVGYRMIGNSPLQSSLTANIASFMAWVNSAFVSFAWPLSLVESSLYVLGIALALRRKDGKSWVLLVIIGISMIVFAGVANQRFIHYSLYWSPLLALLGAKALHELFTRFLPDTDQWLGSQSLFRLAVVALVVLNMTGAAWLALRAGGREFHQMLAQIDASVPNHSVVIADSVWWWVLRDQRTFSDSETLLAFNGKRIADGSPAEPSAAAQDMMQAVRPDFVLVDETLSCHVESSALWKAWQAEVAANCVVIGEVVGSRSGASPSESTILGQTTTIYQCPQLP